MILRFATSNPGKIREAGHALSPLGIRVVAAPRKLLELQASDIAAVARHKARQLIGRLDPPFMVEDAGLHIDALGGFPGVYSHYAYDTIGLDGILRLLATRADRAAHFLATIAYVGPDAKVRLFKGRCEGAIAPSAKGRGGFGFDPIFVPRGTRRTFAQLKPIEKDRVSHRGAALRALARYLARRPRGAATGKRNLKAHPPGSSGRPS